MAGNIKGIFVEIGGDTSGLQKALKDVNSKVASLSKELKGINSLLKLDPKNTELLAQKQTILKENIKATEQQLAKLKETQKLFIESGGNLNTAEYRNLQREIILTENKLKDLNIQASKWTQMSNNLSELSSKMKTFGDTITNTGQKVSVLSAAIAGLFTVGIKNNAELEKNIKIFELFTGSAESAREAVEALKKDAQGSIFGSADLISANRYLLSAGLSAEEARKDINNLANALAAAGGDASMLNNMAYNLAQIRGNSKAAAIDMRQFANTGIPIWQLLADYTGKTREELEKTGVTYEILTGALAQAAKEGGRLEGAMSSLADTTMGRFTKLKAQFQESLTTLTESLMPTINEILSKVINLVEKFNNLSPDVKKVIAQFGIAIVALGPLMIILGKIITAGSTILTGLSKLAGFIAKVAASSGGLSGTLSALAGPVGIVIAVVAALTAAFLHLYKTNEEFKEKVQNTWQGIIDLFNNSVMPVIEQVKKFISQVLNTIWKVLKQTWETIEPYIQEIFESVMDWWNDTGKDIVETMLFVKNKIWEGINWIWHNVLDPWISFLANVLQPAFSGVMGAISGAFHYVLDTIRDNWNLMKGIFQGIIDFITGVFSGNWEKAWNGIKEIFSSIVSGFANTFKRPLNFIIDQMNGFIRGINKIKIPEWVPGVGGKGFNLPTIPRLAKGGIVDEATLAMIGEGRAAEAVIPLDRTLTKYMAEALKQAGGRANITVNFYPQQMTEGELERAFNYIDKRYGMIY